MYFSTDFRGRIVQLTDALDRHDAISNQVLALDSILREQAFESLIAARFVHPDLEDLVVTRNQLKLSEADVLLVHFHGYADGLTEWLADQYCTKVLIYHNITPASFFEGDRKMFAFCDQGREQLKAILPQFHRLWGDSQYNVDELIHLGGDAARAAVIPIIVESASAKPGKAPDPGHWVFVGRMAPNKGVIQLVQSFARVSKCEHEAARSLTLIGGADPNDRYVKAVKKAISESGCGDRIRITGKLSDAERDRILASASLYTSFSEHEGFGVPLVEASLYDVPVLALDRAATSETLGGIGVYTEASELEKALIKLMKDGDARSSLIQKQRANASRFSRQRVADALHEALRSILPQKGQFKTVSVVICTYNRRDYLERCLDYLTFQANGNFEIVVVDGPSDDRTDELLKAHQGRIKVVKNPVRNLSVSRNLGIDASSGDIVAFVDDDAIPFDDWVDRILDEYNARPLTFAGLGGPAYYAGSLWFQAEDNGISRDCQVKVNIASEEIGRNGWMRYNTGTNATFERNALKNVGGFDEQFDYFLDEAEVCFRLQQRGNLIGYSAEVIVRHEFAKSYNRSGKFNYNWFTICKNTAYFIATNSGLTGRRLEEFIDRRIVDERKAPLDTAVAGGELSKDDRDRHVEAIRAGVKQGLSDAVDWPKTRQIGAAKDDFLPYVVRFDRAAVGRDIRRLHICIVTKEFPPFTGSGGVGTLYYHLASELLLMGHEVSVILPGGEEKRHQQGRFSVYFTPQRQFGLQSVVSGFSNNMDWSLSALTALAAIHRDRPVDVVDSALWDSEALALSLLDDRPPLVVRLVTPYAVSAEINEWKPSVEEAAFFNTAEKVLVTRADAVIPISRTIAATVAETQNVEPDQRWAVGLCGIAPWPTFDVNAGYDDFPDLGSVKANRDKLVVFIGRLELRKGIDVICEAAAKILRDTPDATLVVAGRDPEDWAAKFRENIPEKDHDRLVFLGEISDATREKLLAHATCLLFPSRYESFGLVPLEAFVHGTPVVATKAGAIPEVIGDGESGVLVRPNDPDALANAVRSILKDKKLRSRLAKGAKKRVKEMSARNSALHTVEVYRQVVNAN